MSRSGNVGDNAALEKFFSSPKTEDTARRGDEAPSVLAGPI
jgi:transposase InsO family protein